MSTSNKSDSEALTKILLMQNMLGQLPNSTAIFEFVCRGISYLPGVKATDYEPADASLGKKESQDIYSYPVHIQDSKFGCVFVTVDDAKAFDPYSSYIGNLSFMMAAVMHQRAQQASEQQYQIELERRVEERTTQLAQQVAETKLAAKEVDVEKERLAVTLRSIADGVITTNNSGDILSLNRAAERFTGWKQNEALGRKLETVYCLTLEEKDAALSQDGENDAFPRKLISRTGEELLVSHLQSPIHDHKSKKIGSVVVFRDVTKEHRLRERLEKTAKLDSIGVLAGGIAHDFNNLLSGLFGFLELANGSDNITEIREFLHKSTSVYERARNLTGQLLTFSKGGAPVLKVGDVGPVVRDAAAFALSGSNIGCTYDMDANLWSVEFDEHQMSQVVDNLVINAKQSMFQPGNIRVSVKNEALSPSSHPELSAGKYVKISVQDFGVGISHSMLNRIFDPFLTTKQDGSGLGLSTSHSIVQKHHGVIDVESKLEKGSTFHVYLPVAKGTGRHGVISSAVGHQGHGTFLVLDDEAFILEICTAMLTSMGYTPVCFDDGPKVLDYLKNIKETGPMPVAALFDLTIPNGVGGAEIIDAVRQISRDMVIIAASGYSAGDIMGSPNAFGFTGSLPKPFRKKELSAVLAKHLGSSS